MSLTKFILKLGQSLQVSSRREGPAILVSNLNFNWGGIHSTQVGAKKTVRCLDNYWMPFQENGTTYTKCIRVGTEWNVSNTNASFSVVRLGGSNATHAEPEVVVYFSDMATYYGNGLSRDEHTVACLNGTSSTNCDWERIFEEPLQLNGSLSSTTVVEWFLPNATAGEDYWVWFEFDSHLQFGVYSVDYSFGNKIYSATLDDLKPGPELVINPLWILAAWSVDIDGTVNITRFPAMMLNDFGSDFSNLTEETVAEFLMLNYFAMAHAMSLISYESSTGHDKPEGIILYRWVTRRVWAYGLYTKTTILGMVIICVSMVTIMFHFIFTIFYHLNKRYRTGL